jgi:hypothetical protein
VVAARGDTLAVDVRAVDGVALPVAGSRRAHVPPAEGRRVEAEEFHRDRTMGLEVLLVVGGGAAALLALMVAMSGGTARGRGGTTPHTRAVRAAVLDDLAG